MSTLTKILTNLTQRRPESALGRRKGGVGKHLDLAAHKKKRQSRFGRSSYPIPVPADLGTRLRAETGANSDVPSTRSSKLANYTYEREAFERVKWDLIARHPGQFVVFVGHEMLGPYDALATAIGAAYQKYGRRSVYAKKLVADDSSR